MITEDYVSFETAKLLKEKGFDGIVKSFYGETGLEGYMLGMKTTSNSQLESCFYARPTLQMAMKWLREKHNLALSVDYSGAWSYSIHRTNVSSRGFFSEDFNTYEEACEDGIKCCLKTINTK